jgi:probable rRNA maturation factor
MIDTMNYLVDIQNESPVSLVVSKQTLESWAAFTLQPHRAKAELTLRFVQLDEMTTLNFTYRGQNKPTNVLAFPATYPGEIQLDYPLLGDVVICPDVLKEESQSENICLEAHWAHIVIHGILHLIGFDHIDELDAERMQAQEIQILQKLGYANPYQTEDFSLE